MISIRQISFVVLLCAPFSAVMAADWVPLDNTDEMTWEGKAGSLKISTNNSNETVATAMGRFTGKDRKVEFEQWYVRKKDCSRGAGKIVTTDLDGNFRFENDFLIGGGTVATSIAEMLCSIFSQGIGKRS